MRSIFYNFWSAQEIGDGRNTFGISINYPSPPRQLDNILDCGFFMLKTTLDSNG